MRANAPQCACCRNAECGPSALVFSCSGAADTGEIADRAALRLDAGGQGMGKSCLAGIGGRVSGLMANAAAAPALLAIDGCQQDCAKKTLELAGVTGVKHVRVTDLGFKKGKTPATEEAIREVTDTAATLLKNRISHYPMKPIRALRSDFVFVHLPRGSYRRTPCRRFHGHRRQQGSAPAAR